MSPLHLVRFYLPGDGTHVGIRRDDTVYDVSSAVPSIGAWVQGSVRRVAAAIAELEAAITRPRATYPAQALNNAPSPGSPHWLPALDRQEVWAAGVTYARSREARQEEAVDGGDIYARVYAADRPELFFKARAADVVGPHDRVGIRRDARWNVPEPELGLVINPALEIVGQIVGNDMSSRDIEGANPLYLPQAKMYTASCALGAGILLEPVRDRWPQRAITMRVRRAGELVFQGETHTARLRRRPDELVAYLGRCLTFPDGVVLLTGTGIVPPDDFSLEPGDLIQIAIDGVGELENRVRVVGQEQP